MTRDILNQADSAELRNCEREAIHQTQLIQPYGFLVAFDPGSGQIHFASENACDLLHLNQQEILHGNIVDILDISHDAFVQFSANVLDGSPQSFSMQFRSKFQQLQQFEILAHRSGDLIVIECMPFPEKDDEEDSRIQLEGVIRRLGPLHQKKFLPDFLEACAAEIRNVAQYQRVVIYRFLPDWSGEVIAESADAGIETRFLGLRFPSSDIPAQARDLYRKNLLRIIGDVYAIPVNIQSSDPNATLDQSHSLLRSPSPMHLEYLKNMGVRATLTISMIKDGELWGMVACHHHEPKTPPGSLRRVTKLLCALITESAVMRLDVLLHQEENELRSKLDHALIKLKGHLSQDSEIYSAIKSSLEEFAEFLHFQDSGLMLHGQWKHNPAVPKSLVDHASNIAHNLPESESYYSHKISAPSPELALAWESWAGIAVIRLPSIKDSFIFLFRAPLTKQIHWAGFPSKNYLSIDNGLQVIGPRKSFESWSQLVYGESNQWTDVDRAVCDQIAKAIGDELLTCKDRAQQAELQLLGSCMASLNDMVLVTDTSSIDEPGPRIVYANAAFINKSGYSIDEILGKSPRMFQGKNTDKSALREIRRAMQNWESISVELVNYKSNGEEYWIELTLTPIANSSGWYTHWVSVQRDIEERKRSEIDIQKLINYDTLTGLPNRRLLMDRLRLALGNARRYGRNAALMFIDLDHFKNLNDTAGHHVGDELLRHVGIRLVSEVRKQDTVARLGGDEFVVLLEGLGHKPEDAAATTQQIAEKLIRSLDRNFELSDRAHSSSASLGISLFGNAYEEQSAEELLKQADFAMYQAKSAGRNAWRFFDPATQALLVKRSSMESDLKRACASNRLAVHFQPIVNRDKSIVGVEALLRWNDANRGWVSPAEFIPIAEQNGLIVAIGRWVLEHACNVLVKWSQSEIRNKWSIAVNLSARQIRQQNFVAEAIHVIHKSGCNPSLIKLEITESLLQDDFDSTIIKMEALRAIGIQFSIDDFGTGYSSLAYLHRLPISVLKIDRSFVSRIDKASGDQAICHAILALGKNLDLKIIAEGVETPQQFVYLQERGCDYFQGFLFGKAISLDELESNFA